MGVEQPLRPGHSFICETDAGWRARYRNTRCTGCAFTGDPEFRSPGIGCRGGHLGQHISRASGRSRLKGHLSASRETAMHQAIRIVLRRVEDDLVTGAAQRSRARHDSSCRRIHRERRVCRRMPVHRLARRNRLECRADVL